MTRLLYSLIALMLIPHAMIFAAESRRPNILFAFADDWGRYASIYTQLVAQGTPNDVIQTPNFDRVAREGVFFKNAFVTAPSCTPCRSSLLSGQYFWRTGQGAILQGAVWNPEIPSYPLLLHAAGYHIGKSYKVWSPGTPVDAPYGGTKFAYERAGRRFNQFSQNVTKMVAQGMTVEAAKQALYDEVRGNFEAFLADRKPGQPFCYWFGPTNTHRKWIRGSGKALWNIDPDGLQGKMPKFLPDVHAIRQDMADYLGEAQAFDAGLGVLLAILESMGELENTLIVVSGDHGIPGFPRGKCNLYDFGTGVALAIRWGEVQGGRKVDDFVNLTDLAPTFLEAGQVKPPAVMTGRSLIGVLKSGRSGLVDPQRTSVVTGRERHVADARDDYLPYPQRAIRTKDYHYIINFKPDRWPIGNPYNLQGANTPSTEALTEDTMVTFKDMDSGPTKAWLVGQRDNPQWKWHYDLAFGRRPREELYDLNTDPHEVTNLAADPKYSKIREELASQLMAELTRSGDPRVVAEDCPYEKPPYAGPVPQQAKPKPKTKTAS
ncbi:MAG: sulfatase [Pirellulales bacterium]|nr:sulfatase [Pirellulales bacterium]